MARGEYVVAGGMFQGVGLGGIEINAFYGVIKFGAPLVELLLVTLHVQPL